MEIQQLYSCFLQSSGVTTDTRTCTEGSMFFALKGERFDGNTYARQALDAGCAYAVIDNPAYADPADSRLLLVEDTLLALQQLARHHRRQLGTRIIGITGTNGKTTTKELLSAVLARKFRTHYTHGNLNNSIGVPLTLLQLTADHEIAVVEMGASHPGDISELVHVAEPDFGIITNVGRAHLQGFGSFEGVIRTKGELYDFLREKGGSTIFLHNDNPYLCGIADGLTAVRYGSPAEGVAVSGEVIACDPYLCFRWQSADGPAYEVSTRLVGRYNVDNALCAVTVGRFFGVSDSDINEAIAGYEPTNSRSQLLRTERNTLIVDAYNANPTSMRASLLNFQQMKAERKMVIIGDMKELGDASAAEHQGIVSLLQECAFTEVWLVGQQFIHAQSAYRTFANADEVIAALEAQPVCDTTVLVKGSNSMKLSTLIPYL